MKDEKLSGNYAMHMNQRKLLTLAIVYSGGGADCPKELSAYTLAIEKAGLVYNTIPPGAHRFQSDVETAHNLIELEFYEIETFKDRKDFMQKALTYQKKPSCCRQLI